MQAGVIRSPTRAATFVKVALPIPVDTLFTYEVPQEFAGSVFVGSRVEVPLGKRVLSGLVLGVSDKSDFPKTRAIQSVADGYLNPSLVELAKWIASYYGCSLGESAHALLPPRAGPSKARSRFEGVARLTRSGGALEEAERSLTRANRQLALLRALNIAGGGAPLDVIVSEWGYPRTVLKNLVEKGFVLLEPEKVISPLESIEREVKRLNASQKKALESVEKSIAAGGFSPFLLHGVTGSGKTEVYLRAARYALSQNGGCIVLVPEIGLLPQATTRYRRLFGKGIAIIHSRLNRAERLRMWKQIEDGKCRLVLGPRSAIFSPVKNLKLIIVDEEQDDSYKQEDKPRYHARSVALMRGKYENLTVLLGSATPSAESLHQADSGRYEYLVLPERVGGTEMPRIHLIDMREEPARSGFFSKVLIERLEASISAGQQSIIFLNKRGHARFVQCGACGWVARCRNCDISLTYHRIGRRLLCHFCGYDEAAPSRCRVCGERRLFFSGVGTQRVELELQGLFPGVGILRMDADTTGGKRGHRKILEAFSTGRYPVLIGTQMVTKGHHFPGVSLVGVLHAEEGLNFPDFRSAEKTFQILAQVSGRAGREGRGGNVIVQTFMPEHHVFKFLQAHDYAGFMREELKVRKLLKYPPFSRIILASLSSANQRALKRVVSKWTRDIREVFPRGKADILGPSPPVIARVKNRYREQVLIKGRFSSENKQAALTAFERITAREEGGRSVELRWDIDPESFY
ncbi:MAG: primosomal protein N' [Candidatus Latescibacteria bacterium]|nr:primosomal protein N' [Candidatus Latescibacterota bacterium]NIM22590.1 primosomal protein N' [Candidatus Latescibacterota bacterium]NIM64879.1 primosomal protein N' [Candidatus Latescibacterota bacterium]NIO01394.1 primosomal protein N' [Candidatus Latescibacterota bacterium]NIO27904.1 primosomal protein N' [Candidatus Latescibacterota bacterium]